MKWATEQAAVCVAKHPEAYLSAHQDKCLLHGCGFEICAGQHQESDAEYEHVFDLELVQLFGRCVSTFIGLRVKKFVGC